MARPAAPTHRPGPRQPVRAGRPAERQQAKATPAPAAPSRRAWLKGSKPVEGAAPERGGWRAGGAKASDEKQAPAKGEAGGQKSAIQAEKEALERRKKQQEAEQKEVEERQQVLQMILRLFTA